MFEWHREWAEARSTSRSEDEGDFESEAKLQQAGRATRGELMSVVIKGLIVDPNCEFLGAAGGRKKRHRFFESDGEGRTGGGTNERDGHVPPRPFARRIHSTPTLVPRFGLDLAKDPRTDHVGFRDMRIP